MTAAARRFGVVGGVALAVLVATGFGLIDHRGIALADLPDSDYGRRLLAKMGLVVVMGVLALVHALWQGPRVRLSEEAGDAAAAARWRRLGAAIDGALLLAALATLWLAVSLIP